MFFQNRITVVLLWVSIPLSLCSLTGCGWFPEGSSILKGIPRDFEETAGTARILSQEGVLSEIRKPSLSVFQKPDFTNPLLGAVLRIDRERALQREEYRAFLLPQIILSSQGRHPIALTAKFGGVADEIRYLIPDGAFHVGLIPRFSKEWLSGLKSGGAISVDMTVDGVWSRLRVDDLFLKFNFAVTPPTLFPDKSLNPLVVSMLDEKETLLPPIGNGRINDVFRWAELLYYETIPLVGGGKSGERNTTGWVSVRPVSDVIDSKDPTPLELAILWGSCALRDGIQSWLTFIDGEIFVFFGGRPPAKEGFVLSPAIFVNKSRELDFLRFAEVSRNAYADLILKGKTPAFVNIEDRRLFFDLAKQKTESKQEQGEKDGSLKNPFLLDVR